MPKAKFFVEGRRGLLLTIKSKLSLEYRPKIWFHCASLGEFEQARPVMDIIKIKNPNYALVLTFFSPSGYQVRKDYDGVDYVFYLPMDSANNARNFVQYVNPEFAVFVKYDLWYFYLNELNSCNIPILLIDAIFNPNHGFFKWYGSIQRKMLKLFSVVFVQNEESNQLLRSIDVNSGIVAGDTRFDRVLEIAQEAKSITKMNDIATNYKLIVAGSTWPQDETMLARFIHQLPAEWKLFVVPHEVNERRIQFIEKGFQNETIRWSSWDGKPFTNKVMIVDAIGLLSQLYAYGNIAWIGGGFGKSGVHNILEAAVYGLPIAFGPNYKKYNEALELLRNKAVVTCANNSEFKDFFELATKSKKHFQYFATASKDYVYANSGASSVIVHYLEEKNWLKML